MDNSEKKNRIWEFVESPLSGLGAGILIGALAIVLSVKVLFILAWAVLAVSVIHTGFYHAKSITKKIIWNGATILFVGLIIVGIWKMVPKPKEPKEPPSAKEIADEVKRTLKENTVLSVGEETQAPATSQPKTKITNKKLIPPEKKLPIQTVPSESAPPIVATPSAARLSVSQSLKTSSDLNAPVLTEVVVRTDKEFPSLKFAIQCDKPLVRGSVSMGTGMRMITSWGVVQEHPNIFVFSYGSATPPFGPANPLIIDLWSKEPVTCKDVATF